MNQSEIVVRLDKIEKSFGATRVLRAIDLDFHAGEVHAIVGENGAGKSTVGKIIGGYYSFDAGRLEVFGERGLELDAEAGAPARYRHDPSGTATGAGAVSCR